MFNVGLKVKPENGVGSRKHQASGAGKQIAGKVQKSWGKAKDAVKRSRAA